jgi:chromosome segregation ATPase
MSDTPRTDKEIVGELLVFASFARKLERELAAANEERDELKSKYRTHHDEAERITNEIRRISSVCRELKRERDEWKAKYIQQNKALGCEMMDPSGTIWDYASGLQRENVQLKREVAGWMAAAKQWGENAIKLTEQRDRLAGELDALKQSILDLSHPNMKLLLEERKEAREQRDKLAEEIENLKSNLTWNITEQINESEPK